ncbi:MAG: hypothetical protein JWQ49_2375 [Edaphobacter sp.]|nr:hypothetical protein [Edaphobacter sp.]
MRGSLVDSERHFQLLQKLLASFLCLTLLCASATPRSFSQGPGLAASTTLNAAALGNLAVGIHGLVNDAISQANQAAEDRLKQLEMIVNSALFSLTTAINYGIDKMDAAMQANLRVLNDNAQQLIARYAALTKATLAQAQSYLNDDFDLLGTKLGNTVAQVDFLNTTPVLNVPKNGIAIFRAHGDMTEVFLTGVGLTKLSVVPEVKLLGPDGSVTPVTVESYSMAFLKLSIPTKLISRYGNYTLSFNFCVGRSWVFKSYGEQKISVLVCPIPRITISTKVWVEGDSWNTRITQVNQGNLANGTIYGLQCPGGNGRCDPRDITVQATPGWELYDPGWGRLINCVRNAWNGYTDLSYISPTGCRIYSDGRNGDAHLNVVVQIAERQRNHKSECGDVFSDQRDLIGTVASSIDFPRAKLNGDCDSGLILKTLFKSNHGDALTDQHGSLANDQVTVDVGDGIISLKSAPRCTEKEYGEVVVAKSPKL